LAAQSGQTLLIDNFNDLEKPCTSILENAVSKPDAYIRCKPVAEVKRFVGQDSRDFFAAGGVNINP